MHQNKNLIRLAAILWILQILAFAIGYNAFLKPLLAGDLAAIAANKPSFITGMLLEFLAGPCFLAYTVILLPYFKKVNQPLSDWYFGFRIVEFAIICMSTILLLSLVSLSEQYGSDPSAKVVGDTLVWGIDWSMSLLIFVFGVNSFALAWLLYQSNIIPRWLSSLLFVVAAIALFGQVARYYGTDFKDAVILPIVVWELITALWLIVKGVDTSYINENESS